MISMMKSGNRHWKSKRKQLKRRRKRMKKYRVMPSMSKKCTGLRLAMIRDKNLLRSSSNYKPHPLKNIYKQSKEEDSL